MKTVELPLPKMPEALKTTYNKIMHGLSTLPGAVSEGLKPKAGDIAKGLEFGFKAARVVVGEATKMVLHDVAEAVFWSIGPEGTKVVFNKLLAKQLGKRQMKRLVKAHDVLWSATEKYFFIKDRFEDIENAKNTAIEINDKIIKIREKVYDPTKK